MFFLIGAIQFAPVALVLCLMARPPAHMLALIPAFLALACIGEWLLARRTKLALFAGFLVFALLPAIALAADPAPITVGSLFGDLRSVVEPILGVAATGVVGAISWGLYRLTGARLDDSFRAALQSALENGIHAGLDAVQGMADRTSPSVVKNEIVQIGLRYVRQFAPGAVKHFGLDDKAIAELLKAQLGKIVPAVPGV